MQRRKKYDCVVISYLILYKNYNIIIIIETCTKGSPNMPFKRFLLCVTALVLCVLVSGCGFVVINHDKYDSTTETTDAGETAAETVEITTRKKVENDYSEKTKALLDSVPQKDFGGASFKIVTPDTSAFNTDDSPEYLSKAIEKRNALLKEKFNYTVVASAVDYGAYHDEVYTAVRTGAYYADLIVLPQCFLGSFSADGLLMNLRSLPGVDFKAEYFNKSSVAAGSGGFYSYALSGEALTNAMTLPVVYLNKDVCSALSLTSPYDLVSANDWTWDKFFEYCQAAADSDGYSGWGSTAIGQGVYDAAYISTGKDMISSGVMTVPTLGIDSEICADSFRVIEKLSSAPASLGSFAETAAFTDGGELFHVDYLSEIGKICVTPVNFGIVPLPVLKSGDAYRTLAGPNSLMFAVPSTVSTPDTSAIVLMSLNAASYGTIADSTVSYFQYRYLRDNRSANMLPLIFGSAVYDFSYSYGEYYEQLAHGTYALLRDYALDRPELEYLLNINFYPVVNLLNSRFGLTN